MPTGRGRYTRTTERAFTGAVILAAAVVVGAPLYFFLGYVPSERKVTIESLSRELAARTDQRQMGLERWVQDGFQDAATVAQYPSVRALLAEVSTRRRQAGAENADVDALLALFARTQEFAHVLLVDRHAGIVNTGSLSRSLSPGQLRLLRATLATGVPAAEFYPRPASALLDVGFADRVMDDGGRVAGAVLLEADPDAWLYPFLFVAPPLPQRSSEAVLVAQRGDSVVWVSPRRRSSAPPLAGGRLLAESRLMPAYDALRGGSRFGAFVDYSGAPVFAATRRIAGTSWGLVVKVDRSEILSPLRARMQQEAACWGTALLALLGLAGTLWWGARRAVASAVDRGLARRGAALDQANDMVLFLGLDGHIEGANRRAQEFYGGGTGGLIGRHSFDLRPPEARAELPSLLANVLQGASLSFETVHVAAEGTPVPVEVSTRRVHLNDGINSSRSSATSGSGRTPKRATCASTPNWRRGWSSAQPNSRRRTRRWRPSPTRSRTTCGRRSAPSTATAGCWRRTMARASTTRGGAFSQWCGAAPRRWASSSTTCWRSRGRGEAMSGGRRWTWRRSPARCGSL